ncbi:hypothetical protein ABQF35_22750 [Mycobacterium syngnathidarum]
MPETTRIARLGAVVRSDLSRWVALVAVVLATVATGVSVWALVRSGENGSTVGAMESYEAKARVCTAFKTVRSAVSLQTNADLGANPVAKKAVAGNARLAMFGGGMYLLNRLDPSTPPDLAEAMRSLADDLSDIGMNALAEVPSSDPAQADRLKDAEATSKRIADMCA